MKKNVGRNEQRGKRRAASSLAAALAPGASASNEPLDGHVEAHAEALAFESASQASEPRPAAEVEALKEKIRELKAKKLAEVEAQRQKMSPGERLVAALDDERSEPQRRDPAEELIEKAESVLRARLGKSPSKENATLVLVLNSIRRVLRWPRVSEDERTVRGITDADIVAFLDEVKLAARHFEEKDKLLRNPVPEREQKNARLDDMLTKLAEIRQRRGIEAAGRFALRFLHQAAPALVPAFGEAHEEGETAFLAELTKRVKQDQHVNRSGRLSDEQLLIRVARYLGMERADNLFARRPS